MTGTLVTKFLVDTKLKKAFRLGVPTARPVSRMFRESENTNFIEFLGDGSVLVTSIIKGGDSTYSTHVLGNQPFSTDVAPGFRQYYGYCYQVSKSATNDVE